jgi:GxxExxY protein
MERKGPDRLLYRELTREIIAAFYACYSTLGFGFLESVYRKALATELRHRHLHVGEEIPLEVYYRGILTGRFRLDLVVERRVALELKSTIVLGPTDKRQLINYLRASDLRVGLLLHFGPQPSFHRLVSPLVLKDHFG